MSRRLRTAGFTLVEVMISMVIIAFVLLGAVMAMRSQQHSYKAGQWTREAQDSVRRAALVLEQRVRHASLGLDPAFAIDFSYYGIREPLRDASLCPPQMGGCPRDATQDADELVFYVRDPAFRTQDPPIGHAWALTGVTLTTATLTWKPGDAFPAGQILLAICRDPNKYAFFTVSRTAVNGALAGGAASSTTLQLEPVDANDPFRRQDVAAGNPPAIPVDACFASGYVYRVDRYRFHVRPVAVDAIRFEPYLVLDMGIDRNLDGAVNSDDEILVARGIEVFQVSYQLSNGATVGETPGQAIAFGDANGAVAPPSFGNVAANTITRSVFPLAAPSMERSVYFPSSWFPRSSADPARLVNAQGNIRAIHVALVARSLGPDPDRGTNLVIGPGFDLLNFQGSNAAPAWLVAGRPATGDDRYVRARHELTIPLPNMTTRALSL